MKFCFIIDLIVHAKRAKYRHQNKLFLPVDVICNKRMTCLLYMIDVATQHNSNFIIQNKIFGFSYIYI
jgi:hypothetical protein